MPIEEMSGVKHTRWEVEDYGSPGDLEGVLSQYAVLGSGGIPIAYAFTPNEAHIMSAAPALFEALQALATECSQVWSADEFPALKAAFAALSRATTQQEGR